MDLARSEFVFFYDFILRFPTKSLADVCFGDFRIYLRSYSRLTIFTPPESTQESSHVSEREMTSAKVTSVV